jgi:hypothetical protein
MVWFEQTQLKESESYNGFTQSFLGTTMEKLSKSSQEVLRLKNSLSFYLYKRDIYSIYKEGILARSLGIHC